MKDCSYPLIHFDNQKQNAYFLMVSKRAWQPAFMHLK